MNTIKVFKLDLLSIKPYLTLKNLVIFIGLSVIYTALSKNPATAIAVSQMFALLFSSYPFMVGEGAGIDPLYRIFVIEPGDVVKGRYLIAGAFVVISLIFGTVLSLIISQIYSIKGILDMLLLNVPIIFLVITIIIFLEYPIYFKYGYMKGRTLAGVPFMFLGIAFMVPNFFPEFVKMILKFFVMNKGICIISLVLIWIITLCISYTHSNKVYSERDF
ncbi:hypothetical protein HMPREF9333_01772 [Johnsonella ignava ATCC 51276]|uniref:ABC-2 transporter permease n=1 Tax=Johnsonella ignava ATCC 51276 TaxID=679200 RepID=G5GJN2_9FIRM|nr:ABC-2 transporter permease [Johnsonella ignava]EHI55053.1 hypothetical protein HMPREF9333_01772 [Johnsonella ignava ATCC 51276]